MRVRPLFVDGDAHRRDGGGRDVDVDRRGAQRDDENGAEQEKAEDDHDGASGHGSQGLFTGLEHGDEIGLAQAMSDHHRGERRRHEDDDDRHREG